MFHLHFVKMKQISLATPEHFGRQVRRSRLYGQTCRLDNALGNGDELEIGALKVRPGVGVKRTVLVYDVVGDCGPQKEHL